MTELLTSRQAADYLGVTTAAVRKARKRGSLPAQAKIAGLTWLYAEADLARYQAETRRDGSKHTPEQRAQWRESQERHREKVRKS